MIFFCYICIIQINVVFLHQNWVYCARYLDMNKKRHKELQKKRKAYDKRKKERLKAEMNSDKRNFMFQEYLVNCEDALSLMTPANGRIFRLVHSPSIEKDICPTALWSYDELAPRDVDVIKTIPANSSLDDQQDQLRQYTISFNTTVQGVANAFIDRIRQMKTSQQFLKFKNKKGSHICAYDLEPKDGLMWVEPSGHVSLLPYEDFSLDEHLADDFTPISIDEFK